MTQREVKPVESPSKQVSLTSSSPPKRQRSSTVAGYNARLIFATAAVTWSACSVFHSSYCWGSVSSSPNISTIGGVISELVAGPNKSQPIEAYTGPSRVWTKFDGGFPCFLGEKTLMSAEPAHRGFLFQRPLKVGSTTMVSVVLRLVHNRSPWIDQGIPCLHRANHGSALKFEYGERDRSKSFLFSLLRDPTTRIISEFFHFYVAVHQWDPIDRNFLKMVTLPNAHNKYLNDLALHNYTKSVTRQDLHRSFLEVNRLSKSEMENIFKNSDQKAVDLRRKYSAHLNFGPKPNMTRIVQDILDGYDFVAVTERMDESLVVLQMLLNLSTKDILYTRARSSGTFSNGPKGRPCLFIPRPFLTNKMEKYFKSPHWHSIIEGDLLLHKAAWASLDRTIEALGKDEFQRNLDRLKAGLKKAEEHCKGRVRTQCSESGDPIRLRDKTCYIWGEACDHECINELSIL